MGEARRVFEMGPQARAPRPGQPQQIQIQIDPAKDKPKACSCGCIYFQPAVMVYVISAIHPQNPTGQELMTQMAVLVCKECGEALK